MLHKIESVKAVTGYMLYTVFRDGTETLYDVSRIFAVFPVFRDFETTPGLFQMVKVDGGGYGVSWNDDLDIDAEELYINGEKLKNAHDLIPGCPCPICGQMIRRKSEVQKAASIANLSKRKSKGGRPVNPDSKRQQLLKQKTEVKI